ncbi:MULTISPECIES: ISL3 family transposase [Tetragenococcus]|uniref:ISL3 family transposase n=25 Tax=Lactobacillales TaxID=186826 RepID=B1B5H9_TETHA|nr:MULTISPECIES: ISL3 family transposase [Tetragenococcus]MDN6244909.1 ISL3 family transposase [Tetragenococcus koreensis]MDN6294697.1 ISL3 family transposase [Alkalibacterium sp.]MDN6548487.1 ISL3 family transposase [Lactococcus lactis]AOF48415.1 transposase [Tetragenococcus halophilus]AOF48489.1 transposase [Tetragenococcus halophilus]
MLQYKDIKIKDQNLDVGLKNLLNIKDPHIFFSAQAVQKEPIHHRMTNVFYGVLTYTPKACECCGLINEENLLIKHSPKASDIQLIPYQEVPSVLRLFKQRFYCKSCHHTFSARTYYIAKDCYISQALKFAIAIDLKKKLSMKDIALRYGVSFKTVERVLDTFYQGLKFNPNHLPKHLLIDEFKGTKDCEGAMCFIFSDAQTGKIIDILDDRRNFKLIAYFQRFTQQARKRVQHVVMDMNSAYGKMIPQVFPKAKILVDHFHIIQQISRAFNQQRIRSMNQLDKKSAQQMKDYRKLKKYWKQLQKKHKNLGYDHLKQFPLFRQKYVTESEVVDYLLTIDPVLKASYDVYQDLLDAFENGKAQPFFAIIDQLSPLLEEPFKKSLRHLQKYRKEITLSFTQPYSNGKLEGKNNLIKVIQRIAFGFRSFNHLRKRVLIQQGLLEIL